MCSCSTCGCVAVLLVDVVFVLLVDVLTVLLVVVVTVLLVDVVTVLLVDVVAVLLVDVINVLLVDVIIVLFVDVVICVGENKLLLLDKRKGSTLKEDNWEQILSFFLIFSSIFSGEIGLKLVTHFSLNNPHTIYQNSPISV